MRILVVMTHYPFPAFVGSAIVAYNSMKYLSKNHAIDLICLKPIKGDFKSPEFIKNLLMVPQNSKCKTLRNFFGLLFGVPTSVSAFSSRPMKEQVKDTIQTGNYDSILLFEMSAIQYCPASSYSRLIVNIEDPLSIKLNRMRALSVWSKWQKLKLFVLSILTDRYERRFLPQLGKVLLLSVSDMNDMRKYAGYENLAYMPYGVDGRNAKDILCYEDREKIIVFSGNMYHPPNVDGLLSFLNKVFPLILQFYPSAVLWIVGSEPDSRIYDAAKKFDKEVVVTGRVNDISEYIQRASVSICPVRLRIGVQTKVLEALSLGTPVVTTSAGNSGIGGLNGIHFWVEDEPSQFAKRVIDLLNGHGWRNLSEEGVMFVREHFSWQNSISLLEQHIESLVTSTQ